jgi:hypothetical protein
MKERVIEASVIKYLSLNDSNAGVDLLRQTEAAKPDDKSTPVVKDSCQIVTIAWYTLEFSGG